jgi:hypothetical protein
MTRNFWTLWALGFVLALGSAAQGHAQEQGLQTQPSFYWDVDGGARGVSNASISRYLNFTSPIRSESAIAPLGAYSQFGLDLGYQFSGPFCLELGGELMPVISAIGSAGSASWDSYGVYIMPALRFWTRGAFKMPMYQTLCLRVGPAFLYGNSAFYTLPPTGSQAAGAGTYVQSSTAVDAGIVYRNQQMVSSTMDIGMELAYDYVDFDSVRENSGFATNAGGSRLALNLSGVSVKLVFGTWLGSGPKSVPPPAPIVHPQGR